MNIIAQLICGCFSMLSAMFSMFSISAEVNINSDKKKIEGLLRTDGVMILIIIASITLS